MYLYAFIYIYIYIYCTYFKIKPEPLSQSDSQVDPPPCRQHGCLRPLFDRMLGRLPLAPLGLCQAMMSFLPLNLFCQWESRSVGSTFLSGSVASSPWEKCLFLLGAMALGFTLLGLARGIALRVSDLPVVEARMSGVAPPQVQL